MEWTMILISPYSKPLRNGKENPKNYPINYWEELITELKKYNEVVQIGVGGERPLVYKFYFNLPLKEVAALVNISDFWISVDNFLPHLANKLGKRGVVLWSQSDPLIFGYPQNVNILKNRSYLRKDMFHIWEQCEYNIDAYTLPYPVIVQLKAEGLIK